jgi:DNA-binding response OmpR family regulator
MDAKFTLLVVDDVEDNRTILKRRFESVGFVVVEAESGEAALAAVEREPIDLVLLDIQMPGLSGVDTLKEMRAARPATELPIIMVTASTAISDVVSARKLGANDYVTKPIDFNVAQARVKAQLKGRVARSARMARAAG